jgi:hypothetical protein
VFSPDYPTRFHPFASAIDNERPTPPWLVHMMLSSKANWVVPQIGANDRCFDEYPDDRLEDWYRENGLWID